MRKVLPILLIVLPLIVCKALSKNDLPVIGGFKLNSTKSEIEGLLGSPDDAYRMDDGRERWFYRGNQKTMGFVFRLGRVNEIELGWKCLPEQDALMCMAKCKLELDTEFKQAGVPDEETTEPFLYVRLGTLNLGNGGQVYPYIRLSKGGWPCDDGYDCEVTVYYTTPEEVEQEKRRKSIGL
jgi:hypothetical protein